MKGLKILVVLLTITTITSVFNAKVSAYDIMHLTNKMLPGWQQTWNTENVELSVDKMGQHHKIKDIKLSGTKKVSIRLRKFGSAGNMYGNWVTIEDGKSSDLTTDSSNIALFMQGGTFDLVIKNAQFNFNEVYLENAVWYLER